MKARKYSAQYILFCCFVDYMNDETKEKFRTYIVERKGILMPEKQFVKSVSKFVDIERLRTKPMRWQDIWIYNYINYDMPKDKTLLKQFEKQVIIPSETAFNKLMAEIDI